MIIKSPKHNQQKVIHFLSGCVDEERWDDVDDARGYHRQGRDDPGKRSHHHGHPVLRPGRLHVQGQQHPWRGHKHNQGQGHT